MKRTRTQHTPEPAPVRNAEQAQSPWQVMYARQPLWSAEDEKRLTEKREKERARYAHLPETANEETDNEETDNEETVSP